VATYRVQVHGTNFLVDVEGRVAKRGFLTFREVEASDPVQAGMAAIERVWSTPSLRELVRNDAADPPLMAVEEMAELETGAPAESIPTGFIWYEDSPKRWWQFWRR
jgi:hypothetical protein